MALLALLSEFNRAVPRDVIVHHVHHGVAEAADEWAEFVADEAEKRGFACRIHRVALEGGPEFERRAREARYEVVSQAMKPGDVAMTAHHQDDQIETLLLRLAQGSGLIGLAGIPVVRTLGEGVLVRPLLSLTRRQLRQLVAARNIPFVTDPSNEDTGFRRNFIRLQFLPALLRVAPTARRMLLTLSKRASEQVFTAGELLGDRLPTAEIESVPMAATETLVGWQVRFFAQSRGLFAPSTDQITEFARQCRMALDDRMPEVVLAEGQAVVRRWGGRLYWVDLSRWPDPLDTEWHCECHLAPHQVERVSIPGGTLRLESGPASEHVSIYVGVRGRSFRLNRRRPMQSLKQLAQTLSIPPWQRGVAPLLASGDCILGWGSIDAREQGLIPHGLKWEWEMLPRHTGQSTVS